MDTVFMFIVGLTLVYSNITSVYLLIGVRSLIAFAFLERIVNLNVALLITLLITIVETVYTIIILGTLDSVSILSISLVFVLVGLTYKMKNKAIFKLKPAILNVCMGFYMIITHPTKHPFLLEIYKNDPFLASTYHDLSSTVFQDTSLILGVTLILHGIIVGYSGIKHNNFWWIVVSICGLYIAIFTAYLISFFFRL